MIERLLSACLSSICLAAKSYVAHEIGKHMRIYIYLRADIKVYFLTTSKHALLAGFKHKRKIWAELQINAFEEFKKKIYSGVWQK